MHISNKILTYKYLVEYLLNMQHIKVRPLSPHLGIYKPQISSVLSIFHRVSGVALFIGLIGIIWWIIYLPYMQDPENCIIWKFFAHPAGKAFLMLWSYSLFFHTCTGIRHLFWDFGMGFSIEAMNKSGWLSIVISLILAVVSWIIALRMGV
ncbi:succinate dehydrogenase cytochrome b-556 subunit [endosymbiont of Acanthamoeba sp. UWC8]|nr:succinate dehydrogenase cytochrome b-556 subunit [endosymbiont of Acanthamoeba sp. UWC8]